MKERFSKFEWGVIGEIVERAVIDNGADYDGEVERLAKDWDVRKRNEATAKKVILDKGLWIDADLVRKALSPLGKDVEVINQLSKDLFYELEMRRLLSKKHPHMSNSNALPISLIQYLAIQLLERVTVLEVRVPWHLLHVLKGLLPTQKYGTNKSRAEHQKEAAALYLAENPEASMVMTAKEVGVNKSTISRWLKTPEFNELIARHSEDYFNRVYAESLE